MSYRDLINDISEKLQVEVSSKCRLYDSTGGEVYDDDIEYLNSSEPLFFSLGEDFIKGSSMVVY